MVTAAHRNIARAAGLAAFLCLAAAAPPDRIAGLLDALKTAPDATVAATLELRLRNEWHAQLTPAVQLLADRAEQELAAGHVQDARADLDAALDLQPEPADLWRRHAEVRFLSDDDQGAFADLAQSLSREPRLLPALADLSQFAESRKDFRRAIAAWQKLLDLNPHAAHGAERLHTLQQKEVGRPI